jgi:hypothetical protein
MLILEIYIQQNIFLCNCNVQEKVSDERTQL